MEDNRMLDASKASEEKNKSGTKTVLVLALIGILFAYGLISVGLREPYTREWNFQPDSKSSNIESLILTPGDLQIDYMVDGNSYSTSNSGVYSVEKHLENKASIDRMLIQKYDGHFYDADFNYESGVMNVTEGVIIAEEVHYYTDQIYCGTGYYTFETGEYRVDKDNTVITTFTAALGGYLAGWVILGIVILILSGGGAVEGGGADAEDEENQELYHEFHFLSERIGHLPI